MISAEGQESRAELLISEMLMIWHWRFGFCHFPQILSRRVILSRALRLRLPMTT
jgi:hypothetical protein